MGVSEDGGLVSTDGEGGAQKDQQSQEEDLDHSSILNLYIVRWWD